MKILIAVSILLFTQLSSAAFFKTNKACYNIRLKASMVDVNECRRTKVVVTTVNCREIKQRLNQENFNAELNSCKKNKAAGVLDINGDKVKINIFKSSQFGIERWSVVNKSAKMRNNKIYKVYKKTPDKKIKAPKLNLVKQEARPVNDFSFGSNSKFYFYFDTYMAYNSNDPSNGSGGFGDIQNMLRMSDPTIFSLTLGSLILAIAMKQI